MDDHPFKVQIWDTAGQERFRTITQAYYRGAQGLVIAFSLVDRESFERLAYWFDSTTEATSSRCPKVLVGIKCDLVEQITVQTH